MNARVAVGAVVFRDDGRVLLVQRRTPPRAGTWSLPGGKVEAGESLEAAVVREVREETGLVVRAGPLVEVVQLAGEGYAYEVHEIRCVLLAPPDTLRAGDDAADARWCSPDDLAHLDVTAKVRRVVEAARYLPLPETPTQV